MGSVEFEKVRNSGNAVATWLIWIHFDAFFDIPAEDFYFSSTENIDFEFIGTGGGLVTETFQGRLMKDIPRGRHQRDRNQDHCEFSFINAGGATYQDFKAYEPIIERGKVRVYHCLQLGLDYYEGEIRFAGFLKDFTISESDKALKFTAVSDMSRTGFPVGATILTREHCPAEFNFNGTHAPTAYRLCTWQTIQGGNPAFCSKHLNGEDSCMAHGNSHQFAAVPALSTAEITFVNSSDVDFPYENNPCFTENNYICDSDWNIYPISYAKTGTIIKAFDIFTGELVDAEILNVEQHEVESFSVAEFERGGVLEVTRNHLFRVEGSRFAPIGALTGKWMLGRDKGRNEAKDRLKSLTDALERVVVYNLRTTAHSYLITDANAVFYFDVHNSKQHTPMLS